ncbi:nucleotidyl transferase AbiEii/AbiGii toxin family protein [Poseidonibacter ostreae]|uniref:nucleotidyl transferase AbiEii/AbiGii toxin family protein n=1 Tax=Poseidonibacter ostreae TaxID=2654171 RepID=UPI00186B28F4|nr:nucleotidyl transferase AbiEii/AbiGii toxin family protein [Poseidonibacter ostreae]
MKFILDNVKLEFFSVNRPIQKEILKESSFVQFEDSQLKILDLQSIAKLKIVALLERDKSRDLFDFGTILDKKILTIKEIVDISNKTKSIDTLEGLCNFINNKKEPQDDETVYLNENETVNLTFDEIKNSVIHSMNLLINSD